MSTRSVLHWGSAAFAALGLLVILATPGFTHSGGTDKYGCHAGSQPYHCHGGGSGGGSGGGGAAKPKAFVQTGPTAAERAAAAEKQAKIAEARTKLAQAEANLAQSKPRAEKLDKRLDAAEEKLDEQSSTVGSLRDRVDSQHLQAAQLRTAHINERDEAAERIGLLAASNRTALEEHKNTRLAAVFLGALFGGFLLFGIATLVAATITATAVRIVLAAFGLGGSFAFLGLGMSFGSFGMGILPALLGGLLLSFVFMLARAWWMVAKFPAMITIALAGLAGLVAIAAIAAAATMAPPPTEQPAQTDQALVEEAEEDPAAEELEEAQVIDAAADELEPEVEELETDLDAIESKVEALATKTEDAQADAEKDARALEAAKDELDSVS